MSRELKTKISGIIEKQGPITAPEIAGALEAHPVTVRRHCTELQQTGQIRKGSGGGYVSVPHQSKTPAISD